MVLTLPFSTGACQLAPIAPLLPPGLIARQGSASTSFVRADRVSSSRRGDFRARRCYCASVRQINVRLYAVDEARPARSRLSSPFRRIPPLPVQQQERVPALPALGRQRRLVRSGRGWLRRGRQAQFTSQLNTRNYHSAVNGMSLDDPLSRRFSPPAEASQKRRGETIYLRITMNRGLSTGRAVCDCDDLLG